MLFIKKILKKTFFRCFIVINYQNVWCIKHFKYVKNSMTAPKLQFSANIEIF